MNRHSLCCFPKPKKFYFRYTPFVVENCPEQSSEKKGVEIKRMTFFPPTQDPSKYFLQISQYTRFENVPLIGSTSLAFHILIKCLGDHATFDSGLTRQVSNSRLLFLSLVHWLLSKAKGSSLSDYSNHSRKEKMNLYLAKRYFYVSEYNKPNQDSNSVLRFLITSHYLLHDIEQ